MARTQQEKIKRAGCSQIAESTRLASTEHGTDDQTGNCCCGIDEDGIEFWQTQCNNQKEAGER